MISAILQARVSSTRFPGKVLKPILGRPMLLRQIERIKRSKRINTLVVATSDHVSDDAIEILCSKNNIACFRGSLDNVLDRYYKASLLYRPNHIVRLTGDCPLVDVDIIDDVITFYLKGEFNYVSNTLFPTFPDGLDVEIFSFSTLKKAWEHAELSSEKEHVTPFIVNNKNMFKVGNYQNAKDLSHFRWAVDEPEDFELINIVYKSLYSKNKCFTTKDILKLFEHRPELKKMNIRYERNEGYYKSLEKDVS